MKTMLVPVDFSDITRAVIKTAGDWGLAAGCRIHLLHVLHEEADLVGYESGMQLLPRIAMPENPEDNQLMQTCKDELTRRGLEVTTRIVQGFPVLEIIDEAVAVGAEAIVMGSHRHGALHHLLLGSVSGGVLRRAPCPVLIVPSPQPLASTAAEESQTVGSQPSQ